MAYKKQNNLWKIIGLVVLILIIILAVIIFIRINFTKVYTAEKNMLYLVSNCSLSSNVKENSAFVNITKDPINGKIHLEQKANYVCCANITLKYEIENTTLKIYEDNIGKICKCICYYPITATIDEPSITKVEVYGIYYPEVHPYELLGESVI